MKDYAQRLTEVNIILAHMPKTYLDKIPYEVKKAMYEKADKTYSWSYDAAVKLDKQDINIDTVAILSYLNNKYLLNDEQREFLAENRKRVDDENREDAENDNKIEEKNDLEELFEPEPLEKDKEQKFTVEETVDLVPYKENKNIFVKFIDKIKNLFKKKGKH